MKNYELEDFGFEEKMPNDFGKKKETSKSKSSRKSKHKHEYKDCLLIDRSKYKHICKALYCTICGKIHDLRFGESVKEGRWYRPLTNEEILEKYKDLEKIYVDDIREYI